MSALLKSGRLLTLCYHPFSGVCFLPFLYFPSSFGKRAHKEADRTEHKNVFSLDSRSNKISFSLSPLWVADLDV
jgi:hypothetical protein